MHGATVKKMKFYPVLFIHCPLLSKINYYRNHPRFPLKWIDFEFHENAHTEAHALMKGINEITPYFLRPLLGKICFYSKYFPPP